MCVVQVSVSFELEPSRIDMPRLILLLLAVLLIDIVASSVLERGVFPRDVTPKILRYVESWIRSLNMCLSTIAI